MKTHILITAFTAFLLSACASNEGRSISSTQEELDSPLEYSKVEANSGRPVGRN